MKQAMAPFFIILRVADRRALTSEMVTTGRVTDGSIQFRTCGESTGDDGDLVGSMKMSGDDLGERAFGETKGAIEEAL
jgi:hypothetical protein